MERRKKLPKLAMLASGEGSTFEEVVRACQDQRIPAEPALLITNRNEIGAMARAERLKVPALCISQKELPDSSMWDSAILQALKKHQIDFVFLAGFLKKIGPRVLSAYSGRVFNTHPSLLPKHGGPGMYGRKVHEAVIAAHEKLTGVSFHVVGSEYDTGPIVAQIEIPVQPQDTVEHLEARVKEAEKGFVIDCLRRVAKDQPVSK